MSGMLLKNNHFSPLRVTMTTERYPMPRINHRFVYIGVQMHPAYWEFFFAFLGRSPGFMSRLSWSLNPSIFMMALSPFINRNSIRRHALILSMYKALWALGHHRLGS